MTPPNEMSHRYLVTATPPTTNGDLHVGHVSGPYLAADVFCRAQRACGNTAMYVTGGDDHQTFVVAAAERQRKRPAELARGCNDLIEETLQLAGIAVNAYASPCREYEAFVHGFFESLHASGKLVARPFPIALAADGRPLVEAFVEGRCPECYALTTGAICETCGHPNDASSLLVASGNGASEAGRAPETRDTDVLVLPLEDYRRSFKEFYESDALIVRPHVRRFVAEMLNAPLRDFPVTYPGSWGIKARFGPNGQVLNAWAEMLPALMWMSSTIQDDGSRQEGRHPWRDESGFELVQFFGYDNTFYFSLVHLALLFARGGLIKPKALITNEFLHLEGSKFSTSRGHLIWARDLVHRHDADSVRFYLALHNPEHQASNFVEQDLAPVVSALLHRPLRHVVDVLVRHAARTVDADNADRDVFAPFRSRMRRAYAARTFSLREAAETVSNLLSMLADLADRANRGEQDSLRLLREGVPQLLHYAAPLFPELAATTCAQLGLDFAAGDPPRPAMTRATASQEAAA